MTTIANLSVRVAADIAGLTSGLTQADNQIANFGRNVGNKFTALRAGMDNFVAGMAPISAVLGVGLGVGVKAASDFEGILTEIEARTQSTADEMGRLEDFAFQMGAETAFSSQDAAEGMLKLLTSGQDVETAMATLPAVLDTAAASGESLAVAADGVTSIMAAFQVEASGAAGVAESLARASGASKAEMSDLIQAFQNGGSSADAYGLSVNRTAAILGIFANRGKIGAEAGTLLKSMLENMSRNTDSVQEAWDALNTSMYDSQGNMRDFTVIIDDIKAGLEGMTTEEQNRVLQDLAGTYGIAGLRALITGDSIQDMEAAMMSATSATDLADAKMGTFAGKFDTLKGSVETVMIQALTPFMDNVLTPMVEDLTPIINSLGDWVEKNPELTTTILAVAAGLAVATPLVWGLTTAFTAATTAAGILFAPLTMLLVSLSFADWEQIGEGAGQVADGLGRITRGDSSGWETVKTGLTDIGVGLFDMPIGILNTLMDGLEKITGLKLPDYSFEGVLDGLKVVEAGWHLFWDNLLRGFDVFAIQSRLAVNHWIADFRQDILTATGGAVDISPDINAIVNEDNLKLGGMQFADAMTAMLNTQVAMGTGIDMSSMLSIDTESVSFRGTFAQLARNLQADPYLYEQLKEGAGVGLKQALEDALGQSMVLGDEYTVSLLTPLAVDLGVDVAMVEADVARYLTSITPEATLMADVSVSPVVQNIMGFISTVRDALTAEPIVASVQALISVSPILSGVASTVSAVISAIMGAGSSNASSVTPANGALSPDAVDGSHKSGLRRVPRDGYMAELHADEAVLTAEEASDWRGGGRRVENHYHVASYGNSVHDILEMLRREARDGAR